MSTILDALKKSEQERNSSEVPALMTMETPKENNIWPKLLIVVGVVVLLSLLIWLLIGRFSQSQLVSKSEADVEKTTASPKVAQSTPEILVNAISYAEQADKRVAMVNGSLYREQDVVQDGLKIMSIQTDSVRFDFNGQVFTKTP